MNVQAKFMLQEMQTTSFGGGHQYLTFVFRPQYDPNIPEDQRFAKATPNGELKISVDNPAVAEEWKKMLGKQFHLTFSPLPEEESKAAA